MHQLLVIGISIVKFKHRALFNLLTKQITYPPQVQLVQETDLESKVLLIFQGVTAQRKDVPFNIHPKRQNEINNKRRTHSQKGYIHKPGTNAGCSDAQPFANSGTNAKCLPFYKVSEPVHGSKLKHKTKLCKPTISSKPFLGNFGLLFLYVDHYLNEKSWFSIWI
jgi:hypothetical protein